MIRFRDQLAEMLKDKDFAQGYEKDMHAARLAIEIAQARENLGMSQADLASKAHITQQQLSKVENAKACNVETLFKVCDALEMDLTLSPRKAKLETSFDSSLSLDYLKTDFHKKVAARLTPGKSLKHLREAHGLSQSELGALVGEKQPVRASRISDWENDFRAISKPVAKKFAAIFQVSVDRFI
jgi:HTH-type transcriptional regulator / antitoxin HipB